jgi:hypothetical protein
LIEISINKLLAWALGEAAIYSVMLGFFLGFWIVSKI